MNKPKFNPNLPFEVVKPKFDPSKPFTAVDETSDVSQLESVVRGLAQGASFGFSDEITGALESLLSNKSYEQSRDESRRAYEQAQEANPVTYVAGQLGGAIGTAFVPGLGEMNIAKAAAMGGAQALGDSRAKNFQDMALDTAQGAALGGVTQGVMDKAVVPGLKYLGSKLKDVPYNKAIAKLGSFTSGADEDTLLRSIQRPQQMAEALDDGFSNNLGKQVINEVEDLGERLGAGVKEARSSFLKSNSNTEFSNIGNDLAESIDDFLYSNAPSSKGFSGLDNSQMGTLEQLKNVLKGGNLNGEDLVKVRDYLDNVERLSNKYGNDTGPYTSFLKSLRNNADSYLDNVAPDINKANTSFAQYKNDTNLLRSATNEGQAESMINNLYGVNKGVQQEAAARLLSQETLEKAKDIAANKSIAGANRPGGQNYFRHGALPVMTFGASELLTRPEVVAKALRGLGTVEQKIQSVLQNQPEYFGKFARPLMEAASRGPTAVSATHFLLQQQHPEYRQMINSMENPDGK